jgi:hypothetical protein
MGHQAFAVKAQDVKGKEAGRVKLCGNPDVQRFHPVDAMLHLVESGAGNLAIKDTGLRYLAVKLLQLRELGSNVLSAPRL